MACAKISSPIKVNVSLCGSIPRSSLQPAGEFSPNAPTGAQQSSMTQPTSAHPSSRFPTSSELSFDSVGRRSCTSLTTLAVARSIASRSTLENGVSTKIQLVYSTAGSKKLIVVEPNQTAVSATGTARRAKIATQPSERTHTDNYHNSNNTPVEEEQISLFSEMPPVVKGVEVPLWAVAAAGESRLEVS